MRFRRAIRFSAQLNFAIEPSTWEAIESLAPGINKVSKERIQAELSKILLSDHPQNLKDVYKAGISKYVSRAFATIPYESLKVPPSLPQEKYIRWAAFLRLVSPNQAVKVLKDLKLDNDTIAKVKTLVTWSGILISADLVTVRKSMSEMEPEVWDSLLLLNEYNDDLQELTSKIRRDGDCLSLKDLAVNGQDLIAAGIKPGKEIGIILEQMLNDVLEHPEENQKEILLKRYLEK